MASPYKNVTKLFGRTLFLISTNLNTCWILNQVLNYSRANHMRAFLLPEENPAGNRSDVIALVLERGENSRTLFRVCRSWQCMYVLTILTMVERDVGGNDSDGRSITSQMDDGRSRRCDREPIIPRTMETIDLDPRSILHILQNDAPWNQRSRRLNFRIPSFAPKVLTMQTCKYYQVELSRAKAVLNCKMIHNFD